LTYGRTPEQDQVAAAEAVLSMWKYVEGHVAVRDAEPREDLTSDLIRLSRERPEQLNEADIVNIIYSMALASQETTSSSLSNGLLALLRNRDQWERLLAEPELIPNATEEILRFDGSVLSHRRVAKVDTKVGEFDVPAGSPIMMCFASADHDPVQFGADADDFRVDRQGAERHLAFGRGPHLCLGAPLARLEIRVALELLCALTPRIDLVPGSKHEYSPKALFHDLRSLPVAPQGVAAWRAADQLAVPDPSQCDSSRRSVT
jgi:cytochrome P450